MKTYNAEEEKHKAEIIHALDVLAEFCKDNQFGDCPACHIGKTCGEHLHNITLEAFAHDLKMEVDEE